MHKTINLPRQAPDDHRKSGETRACMCSAGLCFEIPGNDTTLRIGGCKSCCMHTLLFHCHLRLRC
jgi:hypothetical protein